MPPPHSPILNPAPGGALSRRDLLQTAGAGFGWLAFQGLFANQAWASPASVNPLQPRQPHFPAKAKRVIFLFMSGGPSQVDTFDYKPELIRQHNKKVSDKGPAVYWKSPWKFSPQGESGLMVSELMPHVSRHADDLCVINSMHTDHNAHPQAILQMNTGSFLFPRPAVGSWIVYGLGTENQNLPGFITITPEFAGGGGMKHSAVFLPAACAGTQIGEGGNGSDAPAPLLKGVTLPFMRNPRHDTAVQARQIDLLRALNHERLTKDVANPMIEGMTASAELAFRMQRDMPGAMDVDGEPLPIREMYGIGDGKETDTFGRGCLMARKFAEAGVRFIQVNHGFWDDHTDIAKNHPLHARRTDQPIGALLTDLKQRGLLEDTLVLWGGEFGRPPILNKTNGREHNHFGFTMWMAGGGAKPGIRYGATDEVGFKAAENKVHLHDLHATLLHLLGLDHTRLTYRYSGRDFRLTDVYGDVVKGVLA